MAKVSGFGGYIVAGGTPNLIVHNSSYSFEVDSLNDDTTDSSNATTSIGGTGFTSKIPIAKEFQGATITINEDDAAYPEAAGLIEGNVLTIWFRRGEDDVFDQVIGTIVRSSRCTNDQMRKRVWEIVTESGAFERDAAAPST